MKRLVLLSLVVIAAFSAIPIAQMRVVPLDEEQGHVALGLALRHLSNVGIFMHTTAHPDDENNGLLVMLNRGQGYRTALATATRGNGGQNEIGPEIFEALGVLRTGELAALHRFDGAEQYFTRAVDFGYSFSIEETFEKWGRAEITADYVRLIRMIRPDVIITLPPTGNAGGQHHMASAVITRDAYKLAGDPTKYPEQIKEGLRPWQPKKLYQSGGFGFPGEPPPTGKVTGVNSGIYDALLGRTYSEIGTEARSMHKCQGMGQLLSLPVAASQSTYQLVETTLPSQMQRDETSLFDGVDSSLMSLAKYAGARAPRDLTNGLQVVSNAVQNAARNFDTVSPMSGDATVKPLLDGLFAVRVLRRELRTMAIDEAGKYEIDFRLRQKEREFQQAVTLATGLKVEALADDGVVVPGQTVKVNVIVANRGNAEVAIKQVKFDGFESDPSTSSGQAPSTGAGQVPTCTMTAFTGGGFGFPGGGRGRGRGAPAPPPQPMSSVKKDQVAHCEPTVRIPANTKISEPYWHRSGEAGRYTFDADAPFGLPFRPTPFYVQATLAFPGGDEVIVGQPVQYRYEGGMFSGEKRTDLLVVPAISVRVTPQIAIVPAASIRSTGRSEDRSVPTSAQTGRGRRQTPAGRAGRAGGAGGADGSGRSSDRPTNDAPGPPAADREIRVTVVNDSPGPADATIRLEAPSGWSVQPGSQSVKFDRADEAFTVRFQVTPSARTANGEFDVRAIATANGQPFGRGFEVIEYPHIRRYHIYDEAETTLKVIDVRVQPNLTVGYIMGTGDQVPPAIQQLGAKVEMIDADELAWGNLSRFDVIVTGIRAYENRTDLRANNRRLLDYVFNGGTVIVQYNKFEFNDAQYGPYPAKVSSDRVTDEFAPPRLLDAHNPVFTTPNEINEAAWKNWVQERGLYFLGEKDSRYHDLLQLEDNFTYNKGPKLGSLVEGVYGRGRWLYVGLGLWRQLPAGTDGAYQLLANLISLGRKGGR
jgi:LmbE family N-acetylglucosaminyl deacetylase